MCNEVHLKYVELETQVDGLISQKRRYCNWQNISDLSYLNPFQHVI